MSLLLAGVLAACADRLLSGRSPAEPPTGTSKESLTNTLPSSTQPSETSPSSKMNAAQTITSSILKEVGKLKRKIIAVIEFSELRGQEYIHSANGRLLAERLTTELVKSSQVEVVERSQLHQVMNELKLESSGMVDDATAKSIGRILGVEAMITGTMVKIGPEIEIHSRLIRVEDGLIMTAVSAREPITTYEDLSVRDSRATLKLAEEELKRLEELQAAVREQQKLKAIHQQIAEKKRTIAEEKRRLEQEQLKTPSNQASAGTQVPEGPLSDVMGEDGAPMVLVPAGEFVMGREGSNGPDGPAHPVYLDAYYIDKFEVTVQRYARFLEAAKRGNPEYWKEVSLDGDAQRPIIGVSWSDADAYCRWVGRRLPTEAEWERAARGSEGRFFPWGDEKPTKSLANSGWLQDLREGSGYKALAPVGIYHSDRSIYGVSDLAGNATEWVADWFDVHYYRYSPKSNPKGPAGGRERVIRGGSYWDSNYMYAPLPLSASSYARKTYATDAVDRGAMNPSSKRDAIGFRCAGNGP